VQIYGRSFYEARHANTRYAAEHILSLALERLPPVSSAVDVGCGVGTWLSCLISRGISDVQGIEGLWARTELLEIPPDRFQRVELSELTTWPRRFDLAISLEVAEHLFAERAAAFVNALCDMSDIVIFSAAVPFQGGKHHVNEQWPEYWVQLFAQQTYRCFDWIRPLIWNDREIPVWYRQNILIFVAERRVSDLRPIGSTPPMPLAVIHPEMYTMKLAPRPFRQRMSNFVKRLLER